MWAFHCSTTAAEVSGSPIQSRIRSVTFSPASRRARCTKRMTSRARPSASSSGVVSSSRVDDPHLARQGPARARARPAAGAARTLPASSCTPPACTVPSGSWAHSPFLVAAMTCWVRGPEPGAEGGGDDVEDRLGQVADGLEQPDLLHVHLVGDQVGVGQEGDRPPGPPPSGTTGADGRGARPPCGSSARPSSTSRARSIASTRSRVRGQLVGGRPGLEVHAALAGQPR